ncbi:MAG: hypothetical protein COA63_005600 [Methylophaga sp.]|nr:hypothetical protein [Methylophaga sp.]
MAFDFYLGEDSTFIDHHEEGIFELINDNEQYPQLNWLWENFYDGPLIAPNIANKLVHELIELRQQLYHRKEHSYLLIPIDRILPLLNKAYVCNSPVKCMSD